jgi:hypothetical protein
MESSDLIGRVRLGNIDLEMMKKGKRNFLSVDEMT